MIDHPETFIFLGRSGCGKGTQAELLSTYIREQDTEKRDVFYLESGAQFRDFISQSNYTAKLSRAVMQRNELQPSFLAVHIWSHLLIERMDQTKHLIVDGTPRLLEDTKIFDSAMRFYERKMPTVVYINVGNDWARERLIDRKRADDLAAEGIEKRLAWFDKDVMPTIEYFRTNPLYRFIEVNGEQSIESVHKELIEKAFT